MASPLLVVALALPAHAQLDQSETSKIRERQPGAESPEGATEQQERPPPPPLAAPIGPTPPLTGPASVVLAAVEIQGATAFPPARLNELYANDLARSLTLDDIQALADRITRFYREHGYLLTRVVIEPQALDSGILRLRVVEGAIRKVSFEGAGSERLDLGGYVAPIEAERPLTLATLERQLLLIGDLDGIDVTDSRVRALDEDRGDYELIVTLDVQRFDLLTYLDNRGTHAIGPLELWTAAGTNGFFGGGERLQVGSFIVPNQPGELRYYELSYTQPLGSQGTKLSLLVSTSDATPGAEYSGTDDRIRSTGVTVKLSHPVVRRRDETLRLGLTFDYQNSTEEKFGATIVDDRLRVIRLRADYAAGGFLDATHYAGLELSQGLPVFDASDPGAATLSRSDGRSDFTKLKGYFSRDQRIGDYIGAQVSVAGQIAQTPLLSSEEFGLGGGQYGRAYNYYEVSGDDGFATAAELRYGQSFDEAFWLNSFQVYGFYDWGEVWNDNASGDYARQTLSSAGAGLRLDLVDHRFSLDLQVARPLTRVPYETGSKSTRFFLSVTGRF
ncbi:Hemolysin activation/secretion protein [Tistlia consotensis]|uniref:Hemolysin activation/secretion protein n=1 Tax=Tistlia consotensis USBA 355 TaxID=560819 RepID=A0A1Y6CFB4_9PROT|nr:ShlB/FhaC/HecB family hemolysin secretion/activation protein [Tistlia consotensis]SMF58307.1 Hemolysin activation/secretion protein [Tistlia consotensis USBA 355]SNR63127.1 Hemolysin activation/secretion protein [Tistlia consotensis]